MASISNMPMSLPKLPSFTSISNMPMSLPKLPSFTSISKSTSHLPQNTHNSSSPFTSSLSLSTKPIPLHNPLDTNNHKKKKSSKLWITFATPEEVIVSDSTALDNSQEIVSTTGDAGVATIIQGLLVVAFVALTILTVGVIYIAVQDFLDKRGREKFEKEEAAKNGKKKKKKNARAKTGPRGFGQKIDEDDDDI